jgi:polar amino acid transport system substrate-binding protein
MKKLISIVFGVLSILNFAQAAEQCNALVITGHPAYPPVAWGADGKIVGASPELVMKIAKDLKVEKVSSVNFGSWEKAQEAIKDGRADVIFGIYKDQERQTYMNYIDPPYMLDPVSIVIRSGENIQFSDWADLKGLKGVTNLGESYGNQFDAYIKTNLTVARSKGVAQAFDQLLNKQADYLIIGTYPGKMEASKLKILSKIQFLPKPAVTADMYVAFSKKSKCYAGLKDGFSAGIKKAVSSGEVKALVDAADKQFYQ